MAKKKQKNNFKLKRTIGTLYRYCFAGYIFGFSLLILAGSVSLVGIHFYYYIFCIGVLMLGTPTLIIGALLAIRIIMGNKYLK